MTHKHTITAVYDDEGNELEVEITFTVDPASGDGWNEPVSAAVVQFDSVQALDGRPIGDIQDVLDDWADNYLRNAGYDEAMEVADIDDGPDPDALRDRRIDDRLTGGAV